MKPQDVTISNYLVESPYTRFVTTLQLPAYLRSVLGQQYTLLGPRHSRCWAAGFPPHKPEFNPRVDHMRFVLHKVASFLNFHPPSQSSIITGCYNTPLDVRRNLLLSTAATKTTSRCYLEWHPGLWNRRLIVKAQRTRDIEKGGERRSKRGKIKR